MSESVRLSTILEVIDLHSDELTSYLNRVSGQVITLSEEKIRPCIA